jgi:hypothetical protein
MSKSKKKKAQEADWKVNSRIGMKIRRKSAELKPYELMAQEIALTKDSEDNEQEQKKTDSKES